MSELLRELRERVDECDSEIAARVVRRAALVARISELKHDHGLPETDHERERQLRLLWSRAALAERAESAGGLPVPVGFWIALGAVFDSVLDFCADRSAR